MHFPQQWAVAIWWIWWQNWNTFSICKL